MTTGERGSVVQLSEGMNEGDASNALFSDAENTAFELIKSELGNFEEYERQFQEVLLSLESDDILDDFRAEYAGLHHSFLKSHEGENRLMHKCLDLQSDIYTCVSKAQTAEELSEGDKQTIEHLQTEAERIKKKAASTKDKEGLLKSKIYEIKKEVAALEKVAQEPVEAAGMEAALQSLQRVHETVLKEQESQAFLLNTAQYEVNAAERRLQKLRERKSASDEELRTVRDRIDAKQYEVKEIMVAKQHKEDVLKALRDKLATGNAALTERQSRIDQLREDHVRNGEEIARVNAEVETLTDDYHNVTRQLQQMNGSLQECNEENDALQKRVKETLEAVHLCQREVDATRKQCLKDAKVVDALTKRNLVAEAKWVEAQGKRDLARHELETTDLELRQRREEVEGLQKQLAAIHRERDLLYEEFLSAEEAATRNKNWLAEKDSQLHHTEHELQAFENHAQKESANIYTTMKECGKYEDQTRTYALKCATTIAEIKMKERQIAEAQHRVTEIEIRLRKQQTMLESVMADRNAYAKHYDQLRHELSEMTGRFQLVLVQITQMKGEVIAREREVATAESHIDLLHRQKREIEGNILAYQRRCEKRSRAVDAFNNELRKLGDVLGVASEEASRQRRRCREVIHERDLLDRQSMNRAKELMRLCETIHSQMGLLQRGEAMYMETARHMEQLEYQMASMEQQRQQLREVVDTLPDLRLKVNNATRELNAEKVKVRAMLTESERPINLHPHHELAWSDPETFKIVERVTALQRELSRRRALLVKKEEEIQAKETTYLSAKATVAKQPGPEVSEQLSAYHGHLIKKRAQLKQMQESLAFFREQTEQYQHREEELRRRLNEMAKEYATRREAQEKERAAVRRRAALLDKDGGTTRSDSSSEAGTYTGFVAPPTQLGAPTQRDRVVSYEEEEDKISSSPPPAPGYTPPPLDDEEDEDEGKGDEEIATAPPVTPAEMAALMLRIREEEDSKRSSAGPSSAHTSRDDHAATSFHTPASAGMAPAASSEEPDPLTPLPAPLSATQAKSPPRVEAEDEAEERMTRDEEAAAEGREGEPLASPSPLHRLHPGATGGSSSDAPGAAAAGNVGQQEGEYGEHASEGEEGPQTHRDEEPASRWPSAGEPGETQEQQQEQEQEEAETQLLSPNITASQATAVPSNSQTLHLQGGGGTGSPSIPSFRSGMNGLQEDSAQSGGGGAVDGPSISSFNVVNAADDDVIEDEERASGEAEQTEVHQRQMDPPPTTTSARIGDDEATPPVTATPVPGADEAEAMTISSSLHSTDVEEANGGAAGAGGLLVHPTSGARTNSSSTTVSAATTGGQSGGRRGSQRQPTVTILEDTEADAGDASSGV